ncbi:MAG: hypothetical protein NVSMB17_01170 [Candidatus Dormibacteria bacterium]
MEIAGLDPHVALVRRWAIDWLSGKRAEACESILSPDYWLEIGGYHLGPRDEYIRATLDQINRYPGLVVTTHQLITSGDQVALWFSEHGASVPHQGRAAAWVGVALFQWDGRVLTECYAEEDYHARRRQLDSGACDPVHPPAAAAWDTKPSPPNPAAETVVQEWLGRPDLGEAAVLLDDEDAGFPRQNILDVTEVRVDNLFSAGDHVAFHAMQTGRYLGGIDGVPGECEGTSTTLQVAGLVEVRDGKITDGRVVRDRLGTGRLLKKKVS